MEERERDRERERMRQVEKERHNERERNKETERQKVIGTKVQRYRCPERQKDIKTMKQCDKKRNCVCVCVCVRERG